MYFVASRTSSVKINYSLSHPYINIHGISQGSVLGSILFIIYILPIKSIFHKYPNIYYHLYADDLQIYSHFLVLVILVFLSTLSSTITFHLNYSPHINNMIRTANYFLYNIRKSHYKLTLAMTKCLIHSLV